MLIVNPVSGKSQAKNAIFDILNVLCRAEFEVTVYMTQKSGDASDFAEKFGPEYDVVACVGGDGTLSEVISGVMHAEKRPVIGYIPMGTTNDMAMTLGIPKNPTAAAEIIAKGNVMELDAGKLGDRYFGYIAGFGAFTEVSYMTPQESKKTLGHFAYLLEGMASLSGITGQRVKVEYDDGVCEDEYLFGAVINSTSVAGVVKIDPHDVGLNDGYFEVLLFRNPQTIGDMSKIVNSVLSHTYNDEGVTLLHTKKAKFTFENPVRWTVDGESGGTKTYAEAENCHAALRILVPEREGEE